MKKVEIISRNNKDKEKLNLSIHLTPSQRILNMLKLMELSYHLNGDKSSAPDDHGNATVIELKLVNGLK